MNRYRLKGEAAFYPWGEKSYRRVLPTEILELHPGETFSIVDSVNSNYRNADLSRWTGSERIGIKPPCDRNISIPMDHLQGIES